MKLNVQTIGSKIDLAAVVLSLAALVLCAVARTSAMVLVYLTLALVCGVLYVMIAHKYADALNLLSVVFMGLALSNYLIASIPTFLDYFNGITMFNSTGGIQMVTAVLVVMGVSALAYIVSCFMKRN